MEKAVLKFCFLSLHEEVRSAKFSDVKVEEDAVVEKGLQWAHEIVHRDQLIDEGEGEFLITQIVIDHILRFADNPWSVARGLGVCGCTILALVEGDVDVVHLIRVVVAR